MQKNTDSARDSRKFLIVDDLPVMRKMLRIALQNLGYRNIVEVANGNGAIRELERYSRLSTEGYSLMLLDLNMPEKNGMEVLKFMRDSKSVHQPPVIVITAENAKEVVLKTMYYGVNEYMIKPITQQEVMDKVKKVLAASASE